MAGSLHPIGMAVDIRHPTKTSTGIILFELAEELGDDFDVVAERTHAHIEYDPD